jgi:glutamate racemase
MTSDPLSRSSAPIGVFDSGVGGLSVWREIVRLLPGEDTLYLADQAHVPYGARSTEEVAALTHASVAWLIDQGAKLIVIACNTATAAALTSLRGRWPDVPIIGMEPAVKPASEATKTGHVAVLATPGTLRASRFSHLVERFANGVQVHTLMGTGLVAMVERNELAGPALEALIRDIFAPVQTIPIDHLVLGCTHFPFLSETLQQVLGEQVTLIDPAPAVARQTGRVLGKYHLQQPNAHPRWQFVTTGDLGAFRSSTERLVGNDLASPAHRISFQQLATTEPGLSGA